MTDTEVLSFARAIKSIWTVELLLFLAGSGERAYTTAQLVKEIRASAVVVDQGLQILTASGLVVEHESSYIYAPASPYLAELVSGLSALYRTRPLAVTQAIFEKESALRQFADAFKVKRDRE